MTPTPAHERHAALEAWRTPWAEHTDEQGRKLLEIIVIGKKVKIKKSELSWHWDMDGLMWIDTLSVKEPPMEGPHENKAREIQITDASDSHRGSDFLNFI